MIFYEYGKKVKYIDLLNASKIDNIVYKENYNMPLLKAFIWAKRSRLGYTILKDDNKIIGYSSFMSLTDEGYDYILDGTKIDVKMPIKYIKKLTNKKIDHNIYFSSIAILPSYQNTQNAIMLIEGMSLAYDALAQSGLKPKRCICDVVSEHGEKVAKIYKGEYIKDTMGGDKLYSINLDNVNRIIKHIKKS